MDQRVDVNKYRGINLMSPDDVCALARWVLSCDDAYSHRIPVPDHDLWVSQKAGHLTGLELESIRSRLVAHDLSLGAAIEHEDEMKQQQP